MIKLNSNAPGFKAMALHENEFKEVSLHDYKDKFVILFFYPADFTFVCPTELKDLSDHYDDLQEMGVEVLSVSTDTHFSHAAWHEKSEMISKIKFAMVADPTHKISKAYDVLRDDEGVADRATFVIDPDGKIKLIEVNDDLVGRNAAELIRRVRALHFAHANPELALPAKWVKGDKTLKPGIDLVGKL